MKPKTKLLIEFKAAAMEGDERESINIWQRLHHHLTDWEVLNIYSIWLTYRKHGIASMNSFEDILDGLIEISND